MVNSLNIESFGYGNSKPQESTNEPGKVHSNIAPSKHGAQSTQTSSTSSRVPPPRRRLMSPESSLRSRLPWLDGKPPSKIPTPMASPMTRPGGPLAASDTSSLSTTSSEIPRRRSKYTAGNHSSQSRGFTAQSLDDPAPPSSSEYSSLHGSRDRIGQSRRAGSNNNSNPSSPRRIVSRPDIRQVQDAGRSAEIRRSEDAPRRISHAAITQLKMTPSMEQYPKELRPMEQKTSFEREDVSRRRSLAAVTQLQLSPPVEQHPKELHPNSEIASFELEVPKRSDYAMVNHLQLAPPIPQDPKELRPKKERHSFEPAFPQKMGLLDAIHPFKSPPSPMCGPVHSTSSAALPPPTRQRTDDPIIKPFSQALDRMEDLMRQAGDLIDEAADTGEPEDMREASNVLRKSSFVTRNPQSKSVRCRDSKPQSSLTFKTSDTCSSSSFFDRASTRIIGRDGPASPPGNIMMPTQVSQILPQSNSVESVSGSSLRSGRTRDRSEDEIFQTPPVGTTYPDSSTRDFAYPTPDEDDWKYCGDHVLGRRKSWKNPATDKIPVQEIHSPVPIKPYTVYVADSPPVSPMQMVPPSRKTKSYAAGTERPSVRDASLRHRKTTGHPNSPIEPQTSYMSGPVSDFSHSEYTGNLPSHDVTPVPWKERTSGQATKSGTRNSYESYSESPSDYDVDPEKNAVQHKPKRKWRLGHPRREPIARKWKTGRKRFSAAVACINTALVGYILGLYAGMVPSIQFQLADQKHYVLLGNIYMYIGLSLTTFFAWPLPLLHGRKPYILAALSLALPLQFPQAILVSANREPSVLGYDLELILCRLLNGFVLGLTNMNDFAVLLDLFGASLMSEQPHQEVVVHDDPRRDGGGLGMWLGIWTWCFIGSISLGFVSGAGIIFRLNPSWGFYVNVIVIACTLVLNIIAPETRRSAYRHHWSEYIDHEERVHRKIARGEIKLHISDEGPKHWFQELWAGVVLSKRMFFQRGFLVLSLYLGWIYGQNILLIVLLGALLSRHYRLPSEHVGLGVCAIALGALIAVPLTKANIFSRARKQGPRTDSMTFESQITWSSHMVRRGAFMLLLPITGVIYTVVSPGLGIHFSVPILFAGAIGFFDALAIAECYGLIMETWDVCDLQPGVNERHRLQSMSTVTRRRRTTYSCFPRVMAGIFVSQSIGFLLAAGATGIGGIMTRRLGAQIATGIAAGMIFVLTLMLTGAMWRFKNMQVIPNHALGTRIGTGEWDESRVDGDWRPVVVGNPSGKTRRMSLLELGTYTRWTEIRRLNKLI